MMSSNTDNDRSLNTLLEDIKLELLSYINKRVRLLKLDTFEKMSISVSVLGYSLIVLLITALILFFVLIGSAFFISELLDSQAAGFGIMALFSLLVLCIVLLCRRSIKRSLLNKTLTFIQKIEANDEE